MILDTVAFVRLLRGELSDDVRLELESAPELMLSAASVYEINQKVRIGRLAMSPIGQEAVQELAAHGLDVLAVDAEVMSLAATMAWQHDGHDHRDPFDRMIVATALRAGAPVATSDRAFRSVPSLEVLPI